MRHAIYLKTFKIQNVLKLKLQSRAFGFGQSRDRMSNMFVNSRPIGSMKANGFNAQSRQAIVERPSAKTHSRPMHDIEPHRRISMASLGV
jgi:hypothetical protein